jgi:Dolichyl-phosphate-mannose-protein mannosyltransferase
MTKFRTWPTSTFGACLFLTVVAVASVGLNTDLSAPPRFDGAGYAILGEALATGRGYREINNPESPRHDHFPPGYPATLALLWRITGRSVVAAHAFSALCTVAAVLLAWNWFRTMYPPRSALVLGLALAINWTWGRVGGSIQSEPFFMLWELLAVLVAVRAGRHGGTGIGIVLGLALAAGVLVRHVGVCLVVAVVVDLALRVRWKTLSATGLTTVVLVLPWVAWLALVHHHPQLGLFTTEGLAERIAGQAVFYLQRLPDQVIGPFVEVGTVLHRSPAVAVAANLWAAMATSIMVWGWLHTLQTPRRRLAGIVAFTTLALLLVWPFTEAGRFLVPLVPFLLVGLTEGLSHALARAGLRRPRDWAVGIVLALSVPYAAYSVVNGRAHAQRRIHADFDAACQWIAQHATRPGPVLTRHPGEVFWQTVHPAVEPDSADPDAINRLIDRLGVTYLLIDEDRYVNAASSPLEQYVKRYPDRVAFVWGGNRGMATIRVFEVRPIQ